MLLGAFRNEAGKLEKKRSLVEAANKCRDEIKKKKLEEEALQIELDKHQRELDELFKCEVESTAGQVHQEIDEEVGSIRRSKKM